MSIRVRAVLAGLSAAGTALLVGGMLWFSRFGLDLTDEGFYLNWISEPGLYPWSTTQFGFVYRPLHALLGGDIVGLRRVNVLLVFALAWLLCHQVLVRTIGWRPPHPWEAATHSAALACSSLVVFDLWLLTPSYNSLAAQGLLVTVTGAVLVSGRPPVTRASDTAGWLLLGLGGWLVFLAKPTTAAALAGLVLILLVVSGSLRRRGALLASGTAGGLLVLSALVIDGSLPGFLERLRKGADQLALLGGGHSLAGALRWDSYSPSTRQLVVLACLALVVVLATRITAAASRPRSAAYAVGAVILLILAATATRGSAAAIIYGDPFSKTLLLAVPLAALVLTVAGASRAGCAALTRLDRRQWTMVGALVVLPHLFAFGTNNNYWRSAGQVAVLWVLAGVVLLGARTTKSDLGVVLLPVGVTVQVLTLLLLVPGVQTPYRQPQPFYDNTVRLEVGRSSSTLVLSAEVAAHLDRTRELLDDTGFEEGDPVLDLTGRSPGVLHAWGASSVVHPWSLGGYPGSVPHETAALANVPCATVAALRVLTEPDGPRSIPGEVLRSVGARVPDDFRVAASWEAPPAVTGDVPRTQVLLEPVRSADEATDACVRARQEGP